MNDNLLLTIAVTSTILCFYLAFKNIARDRKYKIKSLEMAMANKLLITYKEITQSNLVAFRMLATGDIPSDLEGKVDLNNRDDVKALATASIMVAKEAQNTLMEIVKVGRDEIRKRG